MFHRTLERGAGVLKNQFNRDFVRDLFTLYTYVCKLDAFTGHLVFVLLVYIFVIHHLIKMKFLLCKFLRLGRRKTSNEMRM